MAAPTALSDVLDGSRRAMEWEWRVGRSLGRTVYACPSWRREDGQDDILIGIMESPKLAAYIVARHNSERR